MYNLLQVFRIILKTLSAQCDNRSNTVFMIKEKIFIALITRSDSMIGNYINSM